MQVGEIKYGFKLLSIEKLEDINSFLYHYEHLLSGGNVYYLENDDINTSFAIGFRTLPEDSTGVCHIIEHSVLCGSKKYPLKEPFVNLLKNSLSTFLNAFTAYDWTMYPFASQTPKDFDNILSVYLDAVFQPYSISSNLPFLQEGWHLELKNKDEIPSYKGVVYNEMKGAMSSVDEILIQSTLEAMYPDSFYRFNSGGDPDDIVNLTYDDYVKFYKKHYTPQNAMTLFYGKMDIESKLEFLDREYFSKYQKTDDEIIITPQKNIINYDYLKEYEIGEEENIKDNYYMSLCYGLDHYDNYEEMMAMQILCDCLLSKNDSPLKKILLDKKLGQNVEARIDDDNIVPALHIYLQKTNLDKKEIFKETFENAVRSLVENGIDKKLLLAQINYNEFKDKEMDLGNMPKGIIYAMTMMGSFNYRGDIKSHLQFSKYYKKFKDELNNGYFEKLLDKYILNSKHSVEVVLVPSKTLGKVRLESMNKKMLDLKNNMSKEEIDSLIDLNKKLDAYQNHVDTKEELKTLPSLEIKDIPNIINYLDAKKIKIKGMNSITHSLNTNYIAYLRMYFNLSKIDFDDLAYVYLLKNLFLNVPTKNYSTLELVNEIKTYLGDLSFRIKIFNDKDNNCLSYLALSSSSLIENISHMPQLINEVMLNSKFPKKEIKQILSQLTTFLRQDIIENGSQNASLMAKRATSYSANMILNCVQGPILYQKLKEIETNFVYKDVVNKLKDVIKRLFNKDNVLISISSNENLIDGLKNEISKIKLSNKHYENKLNINLSEKSSEALVIPSGVSYNALASKFDENKFKYDGKMIVLSHIVNYDYLWSEVRVKGGAYGTGLSITKQNDVSFSSYRDPNVKSTYEIYKKLPEYLINFKASKEEFKNYIIGAMAQFDNPLSTPSFIDLGDLSYLSKTTRKDKITLKKQVLKTKQKDIVSMGKVFEEIYTSSSNYTIGNEEKIKECTFDKISYLK